MFSRVGSYQSLQGIVRDGLNHRESLAVEGHGGAVTIKLQGLSGVVMAHLAKVEETLHTEDYLRALNWQNAEINQEIVPLNHERHVATSPLTRQAAAVANGNVERGNGLHRQSKLFNHARLDKIMGRPVVN